MEKVFHSCSEEDTVRIGREIAASCQEGDFVALYGEMGSGKTVFMRGFVSQFAPDAVVTSPTYAILNVYEGKDFPINHFDLYRVEDEDDLASTGFDDVIRFGITVTEWSERIPEALPPKCHRVRFEKPSDEKRRIVWEVPE